MLSKISQSIFNTSTASDSTHKCNEKNCQPTRFSGCNFVCSQCLIPKFMECISDRTEIAILMNVLRISSEKTTVQSVISENVKKINDLFGPESILQFVCPACKEGESFIEYKKKCENTIKELKEKNTKSNKAHKKEIDELKKQIELQKKLTTNSQCSECPNLNEINKQLESDIESLSKQIEEFRCDKCFEFNGALNSITIYSAEVLALLEGLNSNWNTFKTKAEKYHSDIYGHLQSLNLCIPELNADKFSDNSKKSDASQTNSALSPHSSTFVSESTVIGKKMSKDTPSNVNNVNVNNVNVNIKNPFKAPAPTATNDTTLHSSPETNKLYIIHVSPFETSVESNEIVDYIIKETDIIDKNYFAVEKLFGPREQLQRKTFISFKISTFSAQVYNKIMNKDLWEPNQCARPFEFNSMKINRDRGARSHQFLMNGSNFNNRNDNQQYNNFNTLNEFVQPPRFQNHSKFAGRGIQKQTNDYRQQQQQNFRQSLPQPRFDRGQQPMPRNGYRFNNDNFQHQQQQQRYQPQQQQQY